MERKSTAVALALVSVSMLAAGCPSGADFPSSSASPATIDSGDSVSRSPSIDEPGAEYWTPERMESAVPYMPTDD